MPRRYIRRPVYLRLMENIDATSGCWIWIGTIDDKGYGRLGIFRNGKKDQALAHRMSYEVFVGEIPPGVNICHRCDTPRCIKPGHLFLGTQADNIRDMWRKGRARLPKGRPGETNYNAKLSSEDGKTIRHLYFAERRSQQEIADFFGIHQAYVSRIVRKLAWEGAL